MSHLHHLIQHAARVVGEVVVYERGFMEEIMAYGSAGTVAHGQYEKNGISLVFMLT